MHTNKGTNNNQTRMHTCIHTFITYMHTYIHYIHYLYTCIYTCIHTYIHACMHACMQTYIRTEVHVRTYVRCTYIHRHTSVLLHACAAGCTCLPYWFPSPIQEAPLQDKKHKERIVQTHRETSYWPGRLPEEPKGQNDDPASFMHKALIELSESARRQSPHNNAHELPALRVSTELWVYLRTDYIFRTQP